jgi:lipid-binding SYLF domain-containing protein
MPVKLMKLTAAIDSALERFTNEIQGGATYLAGARGVLVIPKMIKAGVILGMEFGEGALIVDEIKIQYYRAFTTSLGIQFGLVEKTWLSFSLMTLRWMSFSIVLDGKLV